MNAFGPRPNLAGAIDEPASIADRCHVGIGHQEGGVRRKDRSAGGRVGQPASIDNDETVVVCQQTQEHFNATSVLGTGPIQLLRAGHDLQAGLVPGDELLQEDGVESIHTVQGVKQRESRAHTQEEPNLSDKRIQIDDERRLLRQAGQLGGRVDGQCRGPDPTFGPEERKNFRGRRAVR